MPTDPETNAAWRKWRSTFYFALLVGGMLAVAAAGWWNLSRISSGGR